MERLLAHPPSLPLVHVDHSHRASPALTGKCHQATNPSNVLAEYIVVTTALEKGRPDHVAQFLYELPELICGSTHPKVSPEAAKRATENVRFLTELAAKDCDGIALAVRVDPFTEKTKNVVYVRKDGATQWPSGNRAEIDKEVQEFLTKHYLAEDGPKFIITHNVKPFHWFED